MAYLGMYNFLVRLFGASFAVIPMEFFESGECVRISFLLFWFYSL